MSQKKAKFNIVDIIVVLVLIAGIAFVGMKMFGGQDPAAESPTAEQAYLVTYRADCVPEEIAATLTVGSPAENSLHDMALGTVVDVVIAESVTYGYDSNGQCVASEMPGHVSVTLVCRINGNLHPNGLIAGKYSLNVGQELGICCGITALDAVVWSIAPAATE